MYGESATKLIRHIVQDDSGIIPEYQYELVAQIMRENDELYAENLRTSQTVTATTSGGEGGGGGDDHDDQNQDRDKNLDGSLEGTTNGSELSSTNKAAIPEAQTGDDQPESSNLQDDNDEKVPQDNIDIGEKEIMVMQVRHTAKLWNKRCIIAYHYERLNRLKRLRWELGNNLPREIVRNLSKDELEWFTRYNDNLFSYMNSLNGGKGLDLTLYITPPKKLYIQVRCVRDYGQFDLEDGQPVMLKKDSIHHLPLNLCEKLIHQGVLEQTN